MATILIEDLPLDLENGLTDAELDQLFGAGPRRRTRITYRPPAEVLELRQMLSATPLAGVLDTQVTAFDVTTTGQVAFNLSTGGYSAKVELPGGATLDTTALKTLMTGNLAVPDVNPVKAAAALGGLSTSVTTNYDQVQQGLFNQYGGGNVYMSSRAFTDWASPEHAAAAIGTAVVTGGATTGQIIQEAKDVILNELGNIYTWLKNKAPQEAESLVAGALKAVVTGKDFSAGNLQIKMVNVNESYTVGFGGAAGQIAAGLGGAAARTITAVHKGFAIIWQGSGDSLQSLNKSLNNFAGATMAGKGEFGALIAKIANRPELKGLGKLADAILTSNPGAAVDQLVASKLAAALNLSPAQMKQLYKPGNPIIDLKATQLDEQLVKLFTDKVRLAAGNHGSVSITKLQFNLNTYEITAEISVRHRHTWGSINEILGAVGKTVGKWVDKAGNYVSQGFNAAGNLVRDTVTKGVDKVTQVFDKAGNQLLNLRRTEAGVMLGRWEKTATSTIVTSYTKGVATLQNTYNKAGNLVEKWETTATGALKVLYNNGALSANYVLDKAGKTLEYWRTTANGTMRTYYTNGVATMERTWNKAGTIVEKWEKTAAGTMRTYFTNGVSTLQRVWDKTGALNVQRTWDTAGNILEKWEKTATGSATYYYKNGVSIMHDVWDKSGKIISRWEATATGTMKTWYENGKVTLQRTWDSGGNLLKQWETTLTGTMTTLYKNGQAYLQNQFNSAGDLVSKWTSGGGGGAVNTVKKWLGM